MLNKNKKIKNKVQFLKYQLININRPTGTSPGLHKV